MHCQMCGHRLGESNERFTGECTCRHCCGQPGYECPTFALHEHIHSMLDSLGRDGVSYTISMLLDVAHIALEEGDESAQSRLDRIREVVRVPESDEDMSDATESTNVPEETE